MSLHDSDSDSSVERPIRVDSGNQMLRVLVVDDLVDAAESMCAVLRLFGNEAEMAHDGERAITVAVEFRPHLVLMDLSLPKLGGLEAGKRIREVLHPDSVVVVAMTGWGRDEDRARSLEYGFDSHLTKPVDFTQLKALMLKVASSLGITGHRDSA